MPWGLTPMGKSFADDFAGEVLPLEEALFFDGGCCGGAGSLGVLVAISVKTVCYEAKNTRVL
jgi:hypothetical protein